MKEFWVPFLLGMMLALLAVDVAFRASAPSAAPAASAPPASAVAPVATAPSLEPPPLPGSRKATGRPSPKAPEKAVREGDRAVSSPQTDPAVVRQQRLASAAAALTAPGDLFGGPPDLEAEPGRAHRERSAPILEVE